MLAPIIIMQNILWSFSEGSADEQVHADLFRWYWSESYMKKQPNHHTELLDSFGPNSYVKVYIE